MCGVPYALEADSPEQSDSTAHPVPSDGHDDGHGGVIGGRVVFCQALAAVRQSGGKGQVVTDPGYPCCGRWQASDARNVG